MEEDGYTCVKFREHAVNFRQHAVIFKYNTVEFLSSRGECVRIIRNEDGNVDIFIFEERRRRSRRQSIRAITRMAPFDELTRLYVGTDDSFCLKTRGATTVKMVMYNWFRYDLTICAFHGANDSTAGYDQIPFPEIANHLVPRWPGFFHPFDGEYTHYDFSEDVLAKKNSFDSE